jgi:phosphatidylethanolamine-binding protein (PEBP) family uncharacterized protein
MNELKPINIDISKINLKYINNIKILHGINGMNNYGYHGLCAPEKTGIHRYIFTLFALDNIVLNKMQISGSSEFRDFLNNNNVKILKEESIEYKYSYKNYSI